MGRIRKAITTIRILSLLALPAAAPAAAAGFDGAWKVRIASSNSACGNGATVSIDISNGHVASANAMMTASGRVADEGHISVTLANGIKRAVGSGHPMGTSGSGTWRGPMCSGTWTVQRV